MRSIQLSPVYIRIARPGCSTNRTTGGFFFVWTLFALGTTGWVTMILRFAASGRRFALAAQPRRVNRES